MTRKHFELVARAIAASLEGATPEQAQGIEKAARELALYFHTANTRFDRKRFLEACNVQIGETL